MKYLIVLLLLMPSLAFAGHRHHTQAPIQAPPVQTPVPPTTGNICMNIGYEPINGSYDLVQEGKWLDQLKAGGITCVRLAFYGQNADVTKPLALLAKNKGFYVEIGNDGNPTAPDYAAGVVAEAQWAQANGIDQVTIGNEADAGGQNQQLFAALSCKVRAVYAGLISYDTYKGSYDPITSWKANMGCLNMLGLNIYADYANTMSEAQSVLGTKFYVSETNLDCDYNNQCGVDSSWSSGLAHVLQLEKPYGVKINVFAFTSGGDGVNAHWGMLGHPDVMKVLGL